MYFSKGNLQYTQSTKRWSFAENQWEIIGTDNVTGGNVESNPRHGDEKEGNSLADKVDLFGWSTSSTNFGVSTSTSFLYYSASFVDWGKNKIEDNAPNTWRTLTYNEWDYVVLNRPNASSLKGVAQVNGVNGLVLLPDNWTCPSGVTFKSGSHREYTVKAYRKYQTFTASQWSKLESAGAVFLPAAGYRYGSDVYYVQSRGHYWSATEGHGNDVYNLNFYSVGAFLARQRISLLRSLCPSCQGFIAHSATCSQECRRRHWATCASALPKNQQIFGNPERRMNTFGEINRADAYGSRLPSPLG